MKNFIKKIQSISFIVLIALSMGTSQMAYTVADVPQDISPEDLKMLEEISKEVDSYVAALPTRTQLRAQGLSEAEIQKRETKEKFQEEVDRYSKMSPEELIAEMETAFSQATTAAEPQPELPAPTIPIKEPELVKPEPQKPAMPSSKQQAALQLLDALTKSISKFLSKAQIMVELASKITSWSKQGKLKGWPANLTWNSFKNQVEDLEAKLNKIKDRDPRTQTYKYLDDFIKDESLYNNLTKVKDSLTKLEPKVELDSFGTKKMSSESRQATRSILLTLHEATSVLGIPAALDKILEKYEPTAKKIKESEETAQKTALEKSRVPRTKAESERFYDSGRYEKTPPHYGQTNYEYGRTPYESQTGAGRGYERAEEAKKTGAQAGGGAGSGKVGEAGKGGDAKKLEEGKKEKEKRELDKKADSYETAFSNALEEFQDKLIETPHLKDLEKHLKDNTPIDEEVINAITAQTASIRKAENAANKMKNYLPRLTDSQKKEYKKAFSDAYNQYKSDIDKLYEKIESLPKSKSNFFFTAMGKHQINMHAKFYSYFGDKGSEAELRKYVQNAKAPLTDYDNDINNLLNQKKKKASDLSELKTRILELRKAVGELKG